ncbi:hypothetical protein BLNAU_5667 [Blattamonas nauphoetae]|uniref:Uncharacterized protein n=1 Tax=Blattamonas nauphoetae TaxID=2049346 RepID=A0ABQ9Y6L3_9EUKA|nr:hypothetical protein BLNAU_5667 [Blattamonas nauphoetae]
MSILCPPWERTNRPTTSYETTTRALYQPPQVTRSTSSQSSYSAKSETISPAVASRTWRSTTQPFTSNDFDHPLQRRGRPDYTLSSRDITDDKSSEKIVTRKLTQPRVPSSMRGFEGIDMAVKRDTFHRTYRPNPVDPAYQSLDDGSLISLENEGGNFASTRKYGVRCPVRTLSKHDQQRIDEMRAAYDQANPEPIPTAIDNIKPKTRKYVPSTKLDENGRGGIYSDVLNEPVGGGSLFGSTVSTSIPTNQRVQYEIDPSKLTGAARQRALDGAGMRGLMYGIKVKDPSETQADVPTQTKLRSATFRKMVPDNEPVANTLEFTSSGCYGNTSNPEPIIVQRAFLDEPEAEKEVSTGVVVVADSLTPWEPKHTGKRAVQLPPVYANHQAPVPTGNILKTAMKLDEDRRAGRVSNEIEPAARMRSTENVFRDVPRDRDYANFNSTMQDTFDGRPMIAEGHQQTTCKKPLHNKFYTSTTSERAFGEEPNDHFTTMNALSYPSASGYERMMERSAPVRDTTGFSEQFVKKALPPKPDLFQYSLMYNPNSFYAGATAKPRPNPNANSGTIIREGLTTSTDRDFVTKLHPTVIQDILPTPEDCDPPPTRILTRIKDRTFHTNPLNPTYETRSRDLPRYHHPKTEYPRLPPFVPSEPGVRPTKSILDMKDGYPQDLATYAHLNK